MIARLDAYRPPGSVSSVSVALVTAALRDPDILDANLERVEFERGATRPMLSASSAGGSGRRSRTSCSSISGLPGAPRPSLTAAVAWSRAAHVRRRPSAGRPPAVDRPQPRRERPAHRRADDRGRRRDWRTPPGGRLMTTPLGDLVLGPREGRRVTVARERARPTSRSPSASTAAGRADDRDRDRLLRPSPGLVRPPRTVRPRDRSRRRSPGRRAPHRRGRRARPRCRIRRGARRSGRHRPLRPSTVPMDEALATRRHRHRRAPVRGHRPAVPRRARRCLPTQLVDHALEAFARTAGATLHLPATAATTITWPRPRSRHSAARSGSPANPIPGATEWHRRREPSDDGRRRGGRGSPWSITAPAIS